jgi:hypothetical protein
MQYNEYADEALVRSKARKGVEHFLRKHITGCEDAVAFSHQVRSAITLWCSRLWFLRGDNKLIVRLQVRRRDKHFPKLPRGTNGAVPQPVQGVHVGMDTHPAASVIEIDLLYRHDT